MINCPFGKHACVSIMSRITRKSILLSESHLQTWIFRVFTANNRQKNEASFLGRKNGNSKEKYSVEKRREYKSVGDRKKIINSASIISRTTEILLTISAEF